MLQTRALTESFHIGDRAGLNSLLCFLQQDSIAGGPGGGSVYARHPDLYSEVSVFFLLPLHLWPPEGSPGVSVVFGASSHSKAAPLPASTYCTAAKCPEGFWVEECLSRRPGWKLPDS